MTPPPPVLPLFIAAVCAAATLAASACGSSGEGVSQSDREKPVNQCQRFRSGEAHHFVELSPTGQLIRAE